MIFKDWSDLIGKTIIDIKEYEDSPTSMSYSWRVIITEQGALIEEYERWGYAYLIESLADSKFQPSTKFEYYMPQELKDLISKYE